MFVQVSVVLSSEVSTDGGPTAAVSYTAGFYNIPVISTTARSSAFSNKVSRNVLQTKTDVK